MTSVQLTRMIAFRPCTSRRKSYPCNRLLGHLVQLLARLLARRHFPIVAHRLPCKCRWLAAWTRRVFRVVPIQAEPVEKPVDRAIDRLCRCTDFVVTRMAAKPLDGLKVYCVRKSLPLLFLLKKFLKPPQLPNEGGFLRQVHNIVAVMIFRRMPANRRVSHGAAPATRRETLLPCFETAPLRRADCATRAKTSSRGPNETSRPP